jgi:Fur family peroxide stress response transcriptional regulator
VAQTDVFINTLRQAGRRITEQRRVICEYLAQTDSHPTPYQVYADISVSYPDISRATVYNTLNVLRELGAIVEIAFGDAHTHYETDTRLHVNLVCLRCHKIVDLPVGLASDGIAEQVEREYGFHPIATKTAMMGFCQGCRETKKAEIRQQWLARHQAPEGGEN